MLSNAHIVLSHTHRSAKSFLDIFEERQAERGPGAPSDQDYDLLRAMLLFACSGLDSTVKHLIRDALPAVIDEDSTAEDNFRDFVEKKLPANGRDATLLAAVLTSRDPRKVLVDELVADLVSGSLQSVDRLLRCGSFFNLPSRDLIQDPALFRELFQARNQIAHEMDIDFSQPRRNRATRAKDQFVEYASVALECGAKFLNGVDVKLQSPS